jgi:hypothetical protein
MIVLPKGVLANHIIPMIAPTTIPTTLWQYGLWLKKRIKLLHVLNLGEAGTGFSGEDPVHLVWCKNI